MKYTNNFSVPFWSGKTSLKYNYETAIAKCEQLGNITVDLLGHEEFKPIHTELTDRVDNICNSIDRRFNMRVGEARILINRNDYDIRYDLNSTMTVIHWLKASKNTGRHLFLAGNLLEKSNNFNPYDCQLFQSRIETLPATGKLIVFPSWILNCALPPSDPSDYSIAIEVLLHQC